jgi:hypothetical protein
VRVSADGPATYWVTQSGKRVALFVPDSVMPDDNAASRQLARIAQDAGGETLGAVPKIKMNVPEVEGIFVRNFEGTDLYNFTDVERIVLKKQIAQQWALRLLVGDYDGHAFNIKVGPDGKPGTIDWNLADLLEEGKGVDLVTLLGKPDVATDPAGLAADVETLMRHRLSILQGKVRGARPHYQCMQHVAEQVVFEDFSEALNAINKLDRTTVKQLIGDTYGDQTERVLDVLEARVRCMKGVLEDSFPSIQALLPGDARLMLPDAHPQVEALEAEAAVPLRSAA